MAYPITPLSLQLPLAILFVNKLGSFADGYLSPCYLPPLEMPKHEDFESCFFTLTDPIWVGDLET
jgi:hypothetical protein